MKRELEVGAREEHQAGQTDAVGFPPPSRDRPQSRAGDGNLNVCTKPPMAGPCRERGLEKNPPLVQEAVRQLVTCLVQAFMTWKCGVQIYRAYMMWKSQPETLIVKLA